MGVAMIPLGLQIQYIHGHLTPPSPAGFTGNVGITLSWVCHCGLQNTHEINTILQRVISLMVSVESI